ncbi:MAG: nitrilase-related carbon-nitrogen hydrolase [Parvularculaceae bacterium]
MRAVLVAAFAALGGLIGWIAWPPPADRTAPVIDAIEFGDRASQSAMLLIEPSMEPWNYKNAEALYDALVPYFERARDAGWIDDRTIIVLPEHIGTWLVAAESPGLAYRAQSLGLASLALVAKDPITFFIAYGRSHEIDRSAAAIFRAHGPAMANAYSDVFSRLARDYAATIVAGSIILENPKIENGVILTAHGELNNISAVFAPTGKLTPPLTFKRQLIPSERAFAVGGDDPMPAYDTPAGRLGVLICADAWHPELYDELRAQNIDILATPAFLDEDDAWDKEWRGYVTPVPDDVKNVNPAGLTEGDAWLSYSLPGRITLSGAKAGGAAFLHGRLWDLGSDGRTLGVSNDEMFVGERRTHGSVTLIRY